MSADFYRDQLALAFAVGAAAKSIAFLTDGVVVRKILDHLGYDSEPPILAPARALEESKFAWWARDGEEVIAGAAERALSSAGGGNRVDAQREGAHKERNER